MKMQLFFSLCLLGWLAVGYAQQPILENQAMGGRAAAIGNASANLVDSWAFFNNIAGIAKVENMSILGAFENRFGMSSFNTFSLAFVNPIFTGRNTNDGKHWGTIGLSISRFGDELFNVQRIGLGYAHEIEQVSLGLKVNYTQVAFQDLGSKGTFQFEFGGRAALSSQFSFAAHIFNFNQSVLRSNFAPDERLPVIMKAGLAYTPIKPLLIAVESEKNLQFPATFKAGVEYQIVANFFLRTGINIRPYTNHFGLGYHTKKLHFDYALLTNNPLGLIHQLALQYKIR
ncbi:MAG: hypothetical protein NZ551_08420 [Microscillaceae bacterium]|nr:hypothetical protein [Microscillaceae bacterium]MDW8461223.1 hypothetical protein [Cytophagales bacterium]